MTPLKTSDKGVECFRKIVFYSIIFYQRIFLQMATACLVSAVVNPSPTARITVSWPLRKLYIPMKIRAQKQKSSKSAIIFFYSYPSKLKMH